TISQILATTPGATYNFDFWEASDGNLTNSFRATWDGATLVNLVNQGNTGGWIHFHFEVTASTNATPISFTLRNDPRFNALDDISVNEVAAAVPEPKWLEAAASNAAAPGLVRRVCPFCKDDLASLPRVFCALCMTPHHEGCF